MQLFYAETTNSAAHVRKACEWLVSVIPDLVTINCRDVYGCQFQAGTINQDHAKVSDHLLGHDHSCDDMHLESCLWVMPRVGTLSSWCSKALDIATHCGADALQRIEHGVCYQLCGVVVADLTAEQRAAITDVLSDPMTQTVFFSDSSLQALFDRLTALPVSYVDLLGDGKAALEAYNESMGLCLASSEIDYLYSSF